MKVGILDIVPIFLKKKELKDAFVPGLDNSFLIGPEAILPERRWSLRLAMVLTLYL